MVRLLIIVMISVIKRLFAQNSSLVSLNISESATLGSSATSKLSSESVASVSFGRMAIAESSISDI